MHAGLYKYVLVLQNTRPKALTLLQASQLNMTFSVCALPHNLLFSAVYYARVLKRVEHLIHLAVAAVHMKTQQWFYYCSVSVRALCVH